VFVAVPTVTASCRKVRAGNFSFLLLASCAHNKQKRKQTYSHVNKY